MERIAVIGMGISGMAVVEAYRKERDPQLFTIDCYDKEESFGRGYPYRKDSKEVLLNLKTRKISYNYEDNDDLANWHLDNNLHIKEYTSRSSFGDYTQDRLRSSMEAIGARAYKEMVVRLDYLEDQKLWELETETGKIRLYDRVHLCAGELGQADPFNLEGSPGYIHSVYPCQDRLREIEKNDPVAIIGMGLTGVDVASYLLEEGNLDQVYLLSRSNRIPTVRVDPVELAINHFSLEACQEIIAANRGLIALDDVERLLNLELASHGLDYDSFLNKHMAGGIEGLRTNISQPEDLAKVQALLPPMNLALNKVWVSMTQEDRRKFREIYHPFMCLNRSPLPLVSAQILIEAEDQGRLKVLENVESIDFDSTGLGFKLLSQDQVLASSKYIANATGLDLSMKDLDRKGSLLGSLINKRYLQIDEYGGFTVLAQDLTPLSPRFGRLDRLHLHGVLIGGVQYRNNSTLIIQKTAHDLVRSIY